VADPNKQTTEETNKQGLNVRNKQTMEDPNKQSFQGNQTIRDPSSASY